MSKFTTSTHYLQRQLSYWKNFIRFVQYDVILLGILLIIATLMGYSFGYLWQCILVAVVLFCVWQLRALYFLSKWVLSEYQKELPKLYGVIGFIVDYLQQSHLRQQHAQQALQATIEQAQESLKNLSQAIVVIDEYDCIVWGNLTAIDLLNIDQPHVGHSICEVLTDSQFIEYVKTPDYFPDGIKILCPEYQNRYVQIKITPLNAHHRLIIAYDITRMHTLEQTRKDFVDNVSHELRTPLTVLSGYIETFKDQEDLPARWERAFNQMQSQTKRMTALVNDLLLLSNLENHKNQIQHHLIDMANLMNHIFDDAQGYNVDYGHTLNLAIDSHYDLFGAETEISSAFNNLITNAIKYTPKGGTITISWQDHEEGAYFAVQDTGIGIHVDHLPRLTERFYRVDTARSRSTGGTGLGLAIVKHVLLQHDARLEVESTEGEGSLFKVIFPKHRLFTSRELSDEFLDGEE